MDIRKLRDQLKIDEGCISEVYTDHLGYHTFGIGHLITRDDPEWGKPVGTAIPEYRINRVFEKDIAETIDYCEHLYEDFYGLPEEVQQILANMMFNMGPGGMRKFRRMNSAIEDGQWRTAAKEMQDSRWYNQVGKRSKRLYNRMMDV